MSTSKGRRLNSSRSPTASSRDRPGPDERMNARRQELLPVGALQAVTAVCEYGSMSAAGARLGMTQSAVSQLVKQAETLLGVTLFDRDRRPVRPTSAGHLLWRRAQALLHELQLLPTAVSTARTVPELRLAVSDSVADTIGPKLIRSATEIATHLYVSQGFTPDHLKDLFERRVDIVIAADGLEDVDGLSRYPLLREPLILLHPATRIPNLTIDLGGAPARSGVALSRTELAELSAKLPLIRYPTHSTTGRMADRFLRLLGVKSARRIEVDNASVMCALVGSGVGWAITTPLHVMQGQAHLSGVVVREVVAHAPTREVTLITRAGELEALAIRLAREARKILSTHCLPTLLGIAPWMVDDIRISGT